MPLLRATGRATPPTPTGLRTRHPAAATVPPPTPRLQAPTLLRPVARTLHQATPHPVAPTPRRAVAIPRPVAATTSSGTRPPRRTTTRWRL